MARYKKAVTSVFISARQDTEGADVIAQCNKLASLLDDKPTSVVKKFLREALPAKIAKLEAKVKKEVTQK
jgi:hypothetical protein